MAGRCRGKVFVKDALQLTGVGDVVQLFSAGVQHAVLHAHRDNEEVYLFQRSGEFADGEAFAVSEGSVVRVAPAARAPTATRARRRCILLSCR